MSGRDDVPPDAQSYARNRLHRHRRRPSGSGRQSVPHRPRRRARGARARPARRALAERTVGLAAAADAELDDPAPRLVLRRHRSGRAGRGPGGRRPFLLRRRRPAMDARHGCRQRGGEPRGRLGPGPADAHPGRAAAPDDRPGAGPGVRRWRRPGGLLRYRHRHAAGPLRPDREPPGPAAGGDLALCRRRDRPAPGATLVRQRRSFRRRRRPALRPAPPGRGARRARCRHRRPGRFTLPGRPACGGQRQGAGPPGRLGNRTGGPGSQQRCAHRAPARIGRGPGRHRCLPREARAGLGAGGGQGEGGGEDRADGESRCTHTGRTSPAAPGLRQRRAPYARVGRSRTTTRRSRTIAARYSSQSSCSPESCR